MGSHANAADYERAMKDFLRQASHRSLEITAQSKREGYVVTAAMTWANQQTKASLVLLLAACRSLKDYHDSLVKKEEPKKVTAPAGAKESSE